MKKGLLIIFFIIGIILPVSFASAGTVLSSHRFAWSSNAGYINFDNVVVSDATLTGYAWSENTGWINFSPAQGGVFNDGNGHLSGFAWGEGLGWIDFSGVTISTSTGKFSGTATGDAVGTINFDCPNYCDVRTDWTVVPPPVVVVSSTPSAGGSGSFIGFLNSTPSQAQSYNEPLVILPSQSGVIKKDVSDGLITVEIPANNLFGKTVVIVNENAVDSTNDYLIPIKINSKSKAFYDVYAIDENSQYIHSFAHPIKITLPLSKEQFGLENLGVYWLNEVNWKWVLIPDAVFSSGKVSFNVNHLTKFAIFASDSVPTITKKAGMSLTLPSDKKNLYSTSEKNNSSSTATSVKNIMAKDENNKVVAQRTNGALVLIGIIVLGFIIFAIKRRRKDEDNK